MVEGNLLDLQLALNSDSDLDLHLHGSSSNPEGYPFESPYHDRFSMEILAAHKLHDEMSLPLLLLRHTGNTENPGNTLSFHLQFP